jgi:outer membrane usher protein
VLDWLTLEGHAEAGAGLWNAGAGANMRTGSFGVFSAALAGSHFEGKYGLQSYLAYEFGVLGMSIQLSSQRTFGSYDDLASATARLQTGVSADQQTLLAGLSLANLYGPGPAGALPASVWVSARPRRRSIAFRSGCRCRLIHRP